MNDNIRKIQWGALDLRYHPDSPYYTSNSGYDYGTMNPYSDDGNNSSTKRRADDYENEYTDPLPQKKQRVGW